MTAPVAQTGAGNVTSTSSSSATGLTGNKPSNVADGDLLWALFYHRNASGTVTAPSGWTKQKTENGNGTFCFATKPIPSASAETATTYAFSSSTGSARCTLQIGRITGANLNGPVELVGSTSAFTGTTSLALPAISPAFTDDLLLAVETNNLTSASVAVFTAPSGMTEVSQVSVTTGSATSDAQVSQVALTASGSTGTKTATISPAAGNSAGFLVGIAALPTASATLTATSAMSAAAQVTYGAAATLTASSALSATAAGQNHTASATLIASSQLVASAGGDEVSALGTDGLWHGVTTYELVSGSWVNT